MFRKLKKLVPVIVAALSVIVGLGVFETGSRALNPYMPMWEHIPDGEPYVFEDPDNPGTYRLYVYGSHDTRLTDYCGHDLVVWSAPLDDLTDWRYDGVIFESIVNNNADVLFAPDVALKVDEDGNKTYYLYPNNQSYGRNGMVAESDSPIGPFEVCNWKEGSSTSNEGVLGFDPAVFVDDDGRVYGYWGFQESHMAELDPDTMATIKDGCKDLTEEDTGINSCNNNNDVFRFFEASSMRKLKMNGQTKYVFIYSRMSENGEFGLGATNATLAYAYSDTPLGPWTYGGTIVDARSRDVDQNGKTIATYPGGNTHGSIVEVNGQWYIFYHRCINNDQFSRQGTAEPIDVTITDAGEVVISEAEVTSQGLEINGLNPYKKVSAGAMCYGIGSSYVLATYDEEEPGSPVVANRNGGIIGFKYFNFDLPGWQHLTGFDLEIMGKGVDGTITLMIDSPWESSGGTKIGEIEVSANDDRLNITTKHVDLSGFDTLTGKHGLYMVFSGPAGKDICDLYNMQFTGDGIEPTPTPVPSNTPAPATAAPVVPTATPGVNAQAPVPTDVVKVKKGDKFTYKNIKYVVLNATASKATVAVAGTTKKNITKLAIPATVKYSNVSFKVIEIKSNAFAKCKKLKTVLVGKNIIKIGSKAFANCSALKKVTISSTNIKSVGNKVFIGTPKKKSIKLPKSKAKNKVYKKLLK
ncbi:MAG: glycosyl hydrolase family 43 [Lachnospiraceae bacterium]|nr:glycosyl hydrolase family 43 [Lachnospiraceae bacterium]